MRHSASLILLAVLLAAPLQGTATLDFSGAALLVQLSVSDSSETLVGLRAYQAGLLVASAPPPRLRVLRWRLSSQDVHVVIEARGKAPRVELRAIGRFASIWISTTRYSVTPDWRR